MLEHEFLQVIVRVLPDNVELDVKLPKKATANDVISTILEQGKGSAYDKRGMPTTYRLTPKGRNIEIEENQTLEAAQVQDGDILLMTPDFVAGWH